MGPSALCKNATLSGIGVVDVQKLRVFAILAVRACPSAGIEAFSDLQHARATLRCKKPRFFCDLQHVEVQKLMVFWRFPTCPHDPLRGSAWSMSHFFVCRVLRCACDPLRGSAWSRCKNRVFFSRFLLCARDALWGSCVSDRPRCGPV